MINDKLLRKITNTISTAELQSLSSISVFQDKTGTYHLFNKYTINKVNDSYAVELHLVADKKSFYALKTAVAWCTFDKQNKIVDCNRIYDLDKRLSSIDSAIAIQQRLVKNAKDVDYKMIHLAKLGEEKMKRKLASDELDSYVQQSKIWQTKKFNAKSA